MIDGSIRYMTAMASAKLIQTAAVMDLTQEDFEFVTANRLWLVSDRSRARRAVEALVYGSLDVVGLPRFPAPTEFIAAAIATYVHPVNVQLACGIFEGSQMAEAIIGGVDDRISAAQLFAHVIRIRAGFVDDVDYAQKLASRKLKVSGGSSVKASSV